MLTSILQLENPSPVNALKVAIEHVEGLPEQLEFTMDVWSNCVIGYLNNGCSWRTSVADILDGFFGIKLVKSANSDCTSTWDDPWSECEFGTADQSKHLYDIKDWKVIKLFTVDIAKDDYHSHKRNITAKHWLEHARLVLAELENAQ